MAADIDEARLKRQTKKLNEICGRLEGCEQDMEEMLRLVRERLLPPERPQLTIVKSEGGDG
jgi:hypothetical protein